LREDVEPARVYPREEGVGVVLVISAVAVGGNVGRRSEVEGNSNLSYSYIRVVIVIE